MASSSRKPAPPTRKPKPAAVEPFAAELDSEAAAILALLDEICNARADTAESMDALQLRFAQRATVDDEVLFAHAETVLTKPAELETLARARLRAAAIDALLGRAWQIDSGPARRAWCTLLIAEAKALFADETSLRASFKPSDLRDLHRAAAGAREDVARAFGAR
jgi:hypothetical protein